MKKIVHFTKAQLFTWPGTKKTYADVIPVDHPDTQNVTNGRIAMTSEVISSVSDEAGELQEFETKNTIYRKHVTV